MIQKRSSFTNKAVILSDFDWFLCPTLKISIYSFFFFFSYLTFLVIHLILQRLTQLYLVSFRAHYNQSRILLRAINCQVLSLFTYLFSHFRYYLTALFSYIVAIFVETLKQNRHKLHVRIVILVKLVCLGFKIQVVRILWYIHENGS